MQNTIYSADFCYGDRTPLAPPLSERGAHPVGVDTLTARRAGQEGIELTCEVWYPAVGGAQEAVYQDVLCHSGRPFSFAGRACRGAEAAQGQSPVVILSHGFPGSRVLMTWLAEQMASRGYFVVAPDHPRSLHGSEGDFVDTLSNRWSDDLAALDAVGAHFPGADTENAAVVGYSMGGYGALTCAGATLDGRALDRFFEGLSENPGLKPLCSPRPVDPRIKCIVPLAPWGGGFVFGEGGMGAVELPSLFIAGTTDMVSGYQNIRSLFEGVKGPSMLLTFDGASHNLPANPPHPDSALDPADYAHYYQPTDAFANHNIMQHFIAAFLDIHLKGDAGAAKWFDCGEDGNRSLQGMAAIEPEAPWPGFGGRNSANLHLEKRNFA